MTTRLRLICHASTTAVRSAAFPADEPLDSRAYKKLSALSRHLQDAHRCLTSPALRATQTAQALGLDVVTEPALRECNYGRWNGRSMDDIHAEEPEALAIWLNDPGAAPHGGESVSAMIERIGAWLDSLAGTPGAVVAITHASVIRAAIVYAIDADPRSFWRIDIAPLSLTQLSGHYGRWNLTGIRLLSSAC